MYKVIVLSELLEGSYTIQATNARSLTVSRPLFNVDDARIIDITPTLRFNVNQVNAHDVHGDTVISQDMS